MFTINYGGQNLSILFKNDDNVLRVGKKGFESVQQISCAIVGDDNIPKAVGSSIRSEQDTPSDELGMEIALGRALKRLTGNKEVRASFWSAFYRTLNNEYLAAVSAELQQFGDQIVAFLDVNPMSEAADYDSPLGAIRYNDNVIPFDRTRVA